MTYRSKIYPLAVAFALIAGLTACSSTPADIKVAENLGATTGLPEVELRVEDLTASHRQIRDRFGALETLYTDLRKSTAEQSDMVVEVKRLMTVNDNLRSELAAMKIRQQKSDTLATDLQDRLKQLEENGSGSNKTTMAPSNQSVNDSMMVESTPESPIYAVHLASFRQQEQINSGWSSLKDKYPEALSGLNAKVETSTLPQLGSFLRLLAGPFVSMSEAKNLCDTLQLQNQYCKPAPFKGENIK